MKRYTITKIERTVNLGLFLKRETLILLKQADYDERHLRHP